MRSRSTLRRYRPYSILVLLLILLLASLPALLHGQTVTGRAATIEFQYDNPGLDPSRFTITIDETGKGHYHSEPGAPPKDPDYFEMPSQLKDMSINFSDATRDYLFATARSRKFFAMECEDGKGKMALQGKKDLSYSGSDGRGACTYNWSKDERIERITRIFEAVSVTIEAGSRLTMEHRHDPLALDKELKSLADDFKEGRATEIGNIAAELRSIAQDDSVLDRARTTALTLLNEPCKVPE